MNVITTLIWHIFSNGDFPSCICCDFLRTALSLEKLLRSNYFDTTVTFSEELFLQRIGFFLQASFSEQALLCSSYFFQSSYFLRVKRRIGSSLGKLLFRKATFLVEELFRMKISTEELLFWSKHFCFFRSATFWKKASFSEKQFHITHFFWRAAFFERLLFQKALSSIAVTLSEELLLYNILLNSVPITYS